MKMESFILCRVFLLILMLPSVQAAEDQPHSAVFLPEFALSPQGSFMEDATEDQFLTYRYDDQASRTTRSDEDRDIGWDAWGAWSDCSRTCGGGASYSLRRCLNGGSCDGKNIRYRTCSSTDCPAESGDFRAQQCSAHNDIKYQGVTYEWVPAPYDPLAPCALQCQAKGRSLTVELAPKVLDGTRCRADAPDMCINGVCQDVGCDRQLASGAKEDNCGVCAGDGSTCRLVRGQTLPHLTPEQPLKTLLEVPVGSRLLRLGAKGPDAIVIEAVSLQGQKEETSLTSTGAYVIGNTSLDFQRGTDRQTLRTHGPLKADYIIKLKYRGPQDTVVQFLFYQPIRYQWRETDFFPCSVSCGGGYQLNSAECIDVRSNLTLPEHHCNSYPENTKPTPKLKECNMDPCKEGDGFKEVMPYDHFQPLPRWEQGPWTQCSVSCGGGGWQDRSVLCVEEDSHGQFSQVEEWKCTHSPRPVTRQICNTFPCPQWVAMEWSQCTVTCGRGLRYRVVLCIDHRGQHIGGCETSLKPHVKEDCLVPIACHKTRESVPVEAKVPWLKQAHELEEHYTATEDPTFVPGSWSPCSTTCGVGKQTREVKCRVMLSFTKTEVDLPEEECGKDRPQLERPCHQVPCSQAPGISYTQTEEPYSWDYRGFTACSVTCAGGKQTAVVKCVNRKKGDEVDDSFCDSSSRPPVMIRICNPEPCPPSWEVTVWTSCSASCGVGIQTRSVFCMRFMSIEQQDIQSVSEEECKEFKPPILQPCNQVDCPATWETEPWQLCSQTCGGGVQVRKVYCKQLLSTGAYRTLGDSNCRGPKPATNRGCSNTDCLPFMAGGEWGKCSVTCGLGVQRREQLCRQLTTVGHLVTLDREECSGLSSPPLIRTCRMMTCPKHLPRISPIANGKAKKNNQLVTYGHSSDQQRSWKVLLGRGKLYIKSHNIYLLIHGCVSLLPPIIIVSAHTVFRLPFLQFSQCSSPVSCHHQPSSSKGGRLGVLLLSFSSVGLTLCIADNTFAQFSLCPAGGVLHNAIKPKKLPQSTWISWGASVTSSIPLQLINCQRFMTVHHRTSFKTHTKTELGLREQQPNITTKEATQTAVTIIVANETRQMESKNSERHIAERRTRRSRSDVEPPSSTTAEQRSIRGRRQLRADVTHTLLLSVSLAHPIYLINQSNFCKARNCIKTCFPLLIYSIMKGHISWQITFRLSQNSEWLLGVLISTSADNGNHFTQKLCHHAVRTEGNSPNRNKRLYSERPSVKLHRNPTTPPGRNLFKSIETLLGETANLLLLRSLTLECTFPPLSSSSFTWFTRQLSLEKALSSLPGSLKPSDSLLEISGVSKCCVMNETARPPAVSRRHTPGSMGAARPRNPLQPWRRKRRILPVTQQSGNVDGRKVKSGLGVGCEGVLIHQDPIWRKQAIRAVSRPRTDEQGAGKTTHIHGSPVGKSMLQMWQIRFRFFCRHRTSQTFINPDRRAVIKWSHVRTRRLGRRLGVWVPTGGQAVSLGSWLCCTDSCSLTEKNVRQFYCQIVNQNNAFVWNCNCTQCNLQWRTADGGEFPSSCCSPRAQGRSGIEVDNEQGDKVELWRSYHPEPWGHMAVLVVIDSLITVETHSSALLCSANRSGEPVNPTSHSSPSPTLTPTRLTVTAAELPTQISTTEPFIKLN
ncbi:ADAMTS 3 [Solea senegalensis]|uniref:ADAMTS 3 n=1 Tax=Solea senegalensis TaxID=28829 RepID=A0AAV6Q706_SOLSE|nr:ADAMTS 3 [Solea senegalensis]